jgi:hypothetical protein
VGLVPCERGPSRHERQLLIDARDAWTAYEVNRHTGAIIWQLGGKDSSFTETAAPGQVLDGAGEIFAWQRDPEALGNDVYTFFDDDASPGASLLPYSFSEFNPFGRLIFNAEFPAGVSTYRAYLLPWPPVRPPFPGGPPGPWQPGNH